MRGTSSVAFAAALALCGPALAGDDALLTGARTGRLDLVRERLAAGADPNDYANGYSPLMFAAGDGHEEMTRLLLEKGANPNHKDHNQDSALFWAAYGGHLGTTKLLLAAKASPNIRDRADATPLFTAARYGKVEVGLALIEAGCDPRVRDHTGSTVLQAAVVSGSEPMVALLIEKGAPVNARDDILGETALHLAAERGETGMVARLVGPAMVDAIDGDGQTALYLAAYQGQAAVVKQLLDAGADPARKAPSGETPFEAAARNEKGHAAALLLVDSAPNPGAALFAAARWRHADLVERLLARGASPNARNADDASVLRAAAEGGDLAIVDRLLAAGADPSRDPAALPAGVANPAVVARLLGRGVPVDAKQANGATALLAAAAGGHVESVRMLLAKGADRAAKDVHGNDAEAYMRNGRAWYESIIGMRKASRAYRPTDELEKTLHELTEKHAEIRALLSR
jgi:ankyrin repeat protein